MPRWMQNSTTRRLRGCVSSFNNRSLWKYLKLTLATESVKEIGKKLM